VAWAHDMADLAFFKWVLLGMVAMMALFPQLFTRNSDWEPLFPDGAWVNRGVRIAAFCTLIALGAYLYFNPGSAGS